MQDFNRIASDVRLGRDVKLFGFVNLYGCSIGDDTQIGCFVEIQKNATVGDDQGAAGALDHPEIVEGSSLEAGLGDPIHMTMVILPWSLIQVKPRY
jgi:UDP-3-O-[3-hydroxymyristoyl] glucosamine N-acyltransferase